KRSRFSAYFLDELVDLNVAIVNSGTREASVLQAELVVLYRESDGGYPACLVQPYRHPCQQEAEMGGCASISFKLQAQTPILGFVHSHGLTIGNGRLHAVLYWTG